MTDHGSALPIPQGPGLHCACCHCQLGIGAATLWTAHAAELIAISKAVKIVEQQDVEENPERGEVEKCVNIVSDSQSAIQAIRNPRNKSGQGTVRRMLGSGKGGTRTPNQSTSALNPRPQQ